MTDGSHPFPVGPDPFIANKPLPRHGNVTKSVRCYPCYEKLGVNKFHRHFSSNYYETKTLTLGEPLSCPTCKTFHSPTTEYDRLIIIYSASTLHNVILEDCVRMPYHVNIESICGAKLADLHKDWQATYSNRTKPMDVIIIATANDSPYTTTEQYEKILTDWTFQVWNCNSENSFRVCKMLRPPAKAWFQRNGPLPPNYTNNLEHINSLNEVIAKQNLMNVSGPVIGFNNEGCRMSRKRKRSNGTVSSEISHLFSAWREYSQGKHCGYHLNDKNRVLMLKRLCNYIHHHIINLQM